PIMAMKATPSAAPIAAFEACTVMNRRRDVRSPPTCSPPYALMAIKRSRPLNSARCHCGTVSLTKIEYGQASFALSQLLSRDLGADCLGRLRDSPNGRFHPQAGMMIWACRIRDFIE